MDSRISTIARYTLLEALRTRFPALVLAVLLGLFGMSFFIESITVTEGMRFQSGFYAASMRIACVFIVVIYVLVSVTRELNDKGLDVLLALDLPRSHYVLGKLCGFLAIAALLAVTASLPLAWFAAPRAVAQWMVSLGFELGIVVAFALFSIVAISQLTSAASLVLAFYLLARSLTAMRLIGANPISGANTLSHETIRFLVESLSLVMPSFDAWTQTAWLVNGPAPWSDLVQLFGQGALYVALLACATMFDFYRKNF